jgi:hypothetical protein
VPTVVVVVVRHGDAVDTDQLSGSPANAPPLRDELQELFRSIYCFPSVKSCELRSSMPTSYIPGWPGRAKRVDLSPAPGRGLSAKVQNVC